MNSEASGGIRHVGKSIVSKGVLVRLLIFNLLVMGIELDYSKSLNP